MSTIAPIKVRFVIVGNVTGRLFPDFAELLVQCWELGSELSYPTGTK